MTYEQMTNADPKGERRLVLRRETIKNLNVNGSPRYPAGAFPCSKHNEEEPNEPCDPAELA